MPFRSQPAARKGLAYNKKELVDLGPFKVSPIGLGKHQLHSHTISLPASSPAVLENTENRRQTGLLR